MIVINNNLNFKIINICDNTGSFTCFSQEEIKFSRITDTLFTITNPNIIHVIIKAVTYLFFPKAINFT